MFLLIYSLFFVFFWLNQSVHLFGGDSAEYVTIGQTWSIAHPPGYPFYSLLLNLLRFVLPILKPIQTANILSIFPTVITGYIIFLTLNLLKVDKLISFLVSLIYLFLFPIWLYAEVPEVFALNNLIISLITYLIINGNQNKKYSLIIFLLIGLAISHHHTFVLFIPGWFFLIKDRNQFIKKDFFKKILLIIIGLSFYFYAPISAYFNSPIDYENPITFKRFLNLFFRTSYGTFKAYTGSVPNIFNQILTTFLSFTYLLEDFRILGLLILIIGLIKIFKINKSFFKFIIASFVIHLIFYLYTNFPLSNYFIAAIFERFLISLYLIFIFPLAFGFSYVNDFIQKNIKRHLKNINLKKIVGKSIYLLTFGYLIIVFFTNYKIIKHLKKLDYFDRYAKNLLSTPPKNAIFYSGSDSGVFTTSYFYYVEKYRRDLKFVSFGLINRNYYQEKLKKIYPNLKFPDKNAEKYTLKFINKNIQIGIYTESPIVEGSWAPYGLLWKYYPNEEAAKKDIEFLIKKNIELWNHYQIPKLDKTIANLVQFKALQEAYISKFITFINFLRTYKKYNEAINQIEKIIYQDKITHQSLLNLYLIIHSETKNCQKANQIKNQYFKKKNYQDKELLKTLINYYYYCQPNNSELINLSNQYHNIYLQENQPLNEL
ncbi:MAG: DUF2723 domain-containing protein [Microgenomates group bacterium]|nr:DUF2723 domain-containing protein [Microgenomates group bacterium]